MGIEEAIKILDTFHGDLHGLTYRAAQAWLVVRPLVNIAPHCIDCRGQMEPMWWCRNGECNEQSSGTDST